MDTTKTITHVGLCAGYGGIELGLKRVLPTLRTVAICEIEAFAIANMVAKMEAGLMDPAPVWTDLKSFPYEQFRDRVDILTGGYPCQPFSSAGQRRGTEDPRHLWPWISNGIALMRPKLCFFENVEGHISLGLSDVIEDLGRLGYRTTWGIFSAAETGAPHQRKRVFILAHRIGAGLERFSGDGTGGNEPGWIAAQSNRPACTSSLCAWPSRPGEPQHAWEPPRVVGNTSSNGRQHDQQSEDRRQAGAVAKSSESVVNAAMPRCSGQEQQSESVTRIETRVPLLSAGRESLGNTESGARLGRASGDEGHAAQPDESVGDASRELRNGSRTGFGKAGGAKPTNPSQRQTQPALGGDADGAAGGLDYAELCVTCDNRTDELRLLGNGVVPATAALAFSVLSRTLFCNETP